MKYKHNIKCDCRPDETLIPTIMYAPTALASDIDEVKVAINLQQFMVEPWIYSLSLQKLQELGVAAGKMQNGGHMDVHIKAFISFVEEYRSIEACFVCCFCYFPNNPLGIS